MSLYGLKKQLIIHPSTSLQAQAPKTSDHCIIADIQSSKKEDLTQKSIHMDDDVTYKHHISNKSIIMQECQENFTITNLSKICLNPSLNHNSPKIENFKYNIIESLETIDKQ